MSQLRFAVTPVLRALCSAAILLVLQSAAQAQDAVADSGAALTLPIIVVSPTRFPTPLTEIGSSVTVITADQIEQKQERDLPSILRDVPGLDVVQNGGPGGTASVFMRGTNSNHTKILIDGIDVSDPTTPAGAFDYSQILAADIDRVEVLRGPQSGLYGSDAIGGVINIITKQGFGPPKFSALAEGGSFGTFNQSAGVSGGTDRYDYSLSAVHLHYGNLPVTPSELLAPGQAAMGDAYGDQSYSTKLGANLSDNVRASLVARYNDSLLRNTGENFANFPVDVPDTTQSVQRENQIFTRGAMKFLSLDGALENEFGIAYTRYHRSSESPDMTPVGIELGDRVKYDWRGTAHLGGDRTALLGIESETDRLINSPVIASTTTHSGYTEYHTPVIGQLFANGSLRLDDNETFSRAFTYRLAPAYTIDATQTRLKASYGTGFKAPTLEQLFVDFPAFFFSANPNLRPERSSGYDAGFEQPALDDKLSLGATYFHNHIKDLIQASFTTYDNVSSATTYGVESFIAAKPVAGVNLRADYTYTVARDDEVGSTLLRRPKHKASLNASWNPWTPLTLTAQWLFVGARFDITRDGSPNCQTSATTLYDCYKANSYSLVNLNAAYRVDDHSTLFGRVDNLLDRRYQDPTGFLSPGLSVIAGIRVTWGGE
jgi:vitamin B12 transporter